MSNNRKAAIVTGASRGIGRGIALSLAQEGYDLFITHLNEQDEAEDLALQIQTNYQVRCEHIQKDLTLKNSAKEMVEQAIDTFGEIHLLVNNAGITIFSSVTEIAEEDMDYLLTLNFRAPMLAAKYIAKHMIDNQIRGSIISTTSSRAERAYPMDSIYGGMKAALVRASQSIAIELAPHGIRVNTIAPGAINVRENKEEFYNALGEKIPMGRVGQPDDVGSAVVWLSSEAASYITGVNLRIDGGLILPGMPEGNDADLKSGWGKL